MKVTTLFAIIILCICINKANAQQHNSSAFKTTLDSLQGEWHLKNNNNEGMKIMHDTIFYVSNNKIIDGAILYLSNSYPDSVSFNPRSLKSIKGKNNGKFLIVQSSAINNYEIKSISTTQLTLDKGGKTIDYIKVR